VGNDNVSFKEIKANRRKILDIEKEFERTADFDKRLKLQAKLDELIRETAWMTEWCDELACGVKK
jgi:hypothetical protein